MKTIFRLLLLFFLPLVLASCGDKKESAQSCSIQLDEQKYSTVSENENCSNYERASAYLGRAGMSFANFLKTGATDNLTKTLGISKLSSPTDYTTGNRGFVTNALCLVGANAFAHSSGIHQDGMDYIVSALVISRSNISGGRSIIYGNDKSTRILEVELCPGQGILQPDKNTQLWHDVTPIQSLDDISAGSRSTLGFDFTVTQRG